MPICLHSRRRGLAVALLSTGAVLASVPAFAGSFGLREQSASGQGASFAGAAAGGGESLSGMFWNPAVVNQVEHAEGEQNATVLFPSSKVDVDASTPTAAFGDGGDIGKTAFLTAGYSAYRINENLAVGLSINTPFGLATDPKHDWAGQIFARSSRARSINAAPTIGYKVNDVVSFAAGVQVQYFDIRLRQAFGVGAGAALPTAPTATLKGDDIGVGFTAGMTLTPWEGTHIGVGFRSKIKHNLEGDLTLPGLPDAKIKADVTLPEMITVGVRQRVTEDLTALVGFEWTNWSRLSSVRVKSRGAPAVVPLPTLPFNYDDGYFLSGGLEYKWSPQFTGRVGVAYEWSPINDRNRTIRIPDDNRWWLSVGGSYEYSRKLAFDLGYSYVFVPGKSDIRIPAEAGPPATPPFNGTAKSDVHILSAAVRYKFGEDAAPALVTKY